MSPLILKPFPTLETERLVLRIPAFADEEDINELRSDKRVNAFIDRPASPERADIKKFLEKILNSIDKNESVYWIVTLKDAGQFAGTICLWNFSALGDSAEVGYELLPRFQGRGMMLEAVKGVIDYGFTEAGLRTILAYTDKGNTKSSALLLKAGFARDPENEKSLSVQEAEKYHVFSIGINPFM